MTAVFQSIKEPHLIDVTEISKHPELNNPLLVGTVVSEGEYPTQVRCRQYGQ